MPNQTPNTEGHFWRQETVERALTAAKNRDRLARSYLFIGPEGVGKWAAAQWVAKTLLCEVGELSKRPCGACDGCRRVDVGVHPDWHTLFPVPGATAEEDAVAFLDAKRADPFAVVRFEKRPTLAIGRVRELIAELSKTSVEGGPKVAIIASADQMAGDAQAILLKSIEEPPPNAFFILMSSDPGRILPTVRSRCQTIRFAPVEPGAIAMRLSEEFSIDADDAEVAAQLCGGGWGNAVHLISDESRAWRQVALTFWQTAFRSSPGEMLEEIEKRFRRKKFDQMIQAFDVWGLLLRHDCARAIESPPRAELLDGAPVPDIETGWVCWRILQNGRATLWVNVAARSAVTGTFLALRRRLRCL